MQIALDLGKCIAHSVLVMRTHETIIADAGGYRGLAAAIGLPVSRVRFWARRKAIPAEVWRAVSHAQIASLEELAAAAEARAASETHTPTKVNRSVKPKGVRSEDTAVVGAGK